MLTLDQDMPFGKYKGRKVKEVVESDPGYAIWLREEKRVSNPSKPPTFDISINRALDKAIVGSKTLSRKYKPWNMDDANQHGVTVTVHDVDSLDAEQAAAMQIAHYGEEWAAW